MNDAHSSGHGSGERRLQAQTRRRALPFVLLLLLGGALGFGLAWAEAGRLARVAPAVLWCGIGLLAAAASAAIVAWMRRVDEVEVADQLWSSFVGLQALTLGAFGWEILAAAGAAPPVNRYAVYFATGATMLAAYGWRRFRRA